MITPTQLTRKTRTRFNLRSSAVLRLTPTTSTKVSAYLLTGIRVSHHITAFDIDELIKDTAEGAGIALDHPPPPPPVGRKKKKTTTGPKKTDLFAPTGAETLR
jgi:hypothetical protein